MLHINKCVTLITRHLTIGVVLLSFAGCSSFKIASADGSTATDALARDGARAETADTTPPSGDDGGAGGSDVAMSDAGASDLGQSVDGAGGSDVAMSDAGASDLGQSVDGTLDLVSTKDGPGPDGEVADMGCNGTNDPQHCGSSCLVCAGPLTGAATGSAICSNGTCDVRCGSSFKQCGHSCLSGCANNSVCAGETCVCPSAQPVLDGGLCCPVGQRNCGGACVACAAGSICAGQACACPTTSTCAPSVPSGWLGPVAADLAAQSACGTNYPNMVALGANPQSTPVTCSCSCGACAGGKCDVFADAYDSSSGNCDVFDHSTLIGNAYPDCAGPGVSKSFEYSVRGVASTVGATCPVTTNNKTRPQPTWGSKARVCNGATSTPGACTNSALCTRTVAGTEKLCVYRSASGAQACPAGYPTQTIWYSGFADNRDCTCSCNPSSATCSPELWMTDNACPGTQNAQVGSCTPFIGVSSLGGLTVYNANLKVDGTPSFSSSGSVTGDSASTITVCCTN